jgi:hypothetical protein
MLKFPDMERRPCKESEKPFFNVFLATSIADLKENENALARSGENPFLRFSPAQLLTSWDNLEDSIQSLITLKPKKIESSVFIILFTVRHFPENDDPSAKNKLKLVDPTGEIEVEMPSGLLGVIERMILPKDVKNSSWCKDILLLARYSNRDRRYILFAFLDEPTQEQHEGLSKLLPRPKLV